MGKLADMVSEDLSLTEKLIISLRKMGLAGVGLASLLEAERVRIYRQALELGEPFGKSDSVVGLISRLGTGTVSLVVEESQRLFDELVEEGEQALQRNRQSQAAAPAVKVPSTDKIGQARSVGRSRPAAKSKAKPVKTAGQSGSAVARPESDGDSEAAVHQALQQRLQKALMLFSGRGVDEHLQVEVEALRLQVQEGDVTGRRPAKTKPQAQLAFDARHQLKGMKPDEALKRLEALARRSSPQAAL